MKYQLNIVCNKWFLKVKKFIFWKRVKTLLEAKTLLGIKDE